MLFQLSLYSLSYLLCLIGKISIFFIYLYDINSFLSLSRSLNKGTNFYPNQIEILFLNIKLLFAPLVKGSRWKSLVRKDNAELNPEKLTRVIQFIPNIKHITKFKKVCSLKDDDTSIPFLYPAAIVLYPNVCLMADPAYPFPAIGSVHVYNTTTLFKKLTVDETFSCIIKADKTITHVKKGSEVEFISTLLDSENNPAWINSSKFLVMHKAHSKRQSSIATPPPSQTDTTTSTDTGNVQQQLAGTQWPEPVESDLTLVREDEWKLGSHISLDYAAVSKDYNPIHTSTLAAKLFGFPGIIIHGTYYILVV